MRASFALLAAVCLAGAFAPNVRAHPNLVRTQPGAGTVLARAPKEVRVVFDTAVRPAAGIRAIRNGGGSVLGGSPHLSAGSNRILVIPLRRSLGAGDFTVRWRIRSDDGHLISGVLAFGVGSGRPPPTPALSAGGGRPAGGAVLRRFLFFTGVLLAAGGVGFLFLVSGSWRPGALVPLAGFALVLAGSQPDLSPASRFEYFNDLAVLGALAGVIASAAMLARPGWRLPALAPAAAVLVVPTLRGHALDQGQIVPLAVAADLLHLAAAAFWVGGLAQLSAMLALGRPRPFSVERFSAGALISVIVVGATGLVRAFGELSALDQLWHTGYGRVLLVKTMLLTGLVALAWTNRARLRSARPLRRGLVAELLVLAGLVTAVSLLTELRPGRHLALARTSEASARPSPLRLPPRGALVLARRSGSYAVAAAVRRADRGVELIASVLGPDQLGVNGLPVQVQVGRTLVQARRCGGGCYSARLSGSPRFVAVRFGRHRARFELPSLPPRPASRVVASAERTWRSLFTLVLHERLASGPGNSISSVFEFQAPNRMAYRIRGGPAGIVIGATRWDRASALARWVRSPQDPVPQPEPFWTSVSNAYVLETGKRVWVVSFLDRSIPAWFTATIDRRTYRTLVLRMTAAAHFMHHRYGPFNAAVSIRPPA